LKHFLIYSFIIALDNLVLTPSPATYASDNMMIASTSTGSGDQFHQDQPTKRCKTPHRNVPDVIFNIIEMIFLTSFLTFQVPISDISRTRLCLKLRRDFSKSR